ncbi:MAG: NADH:ubiquinone oxidoreductase, partial [Bacteroidota bacterium]|nr:NADH:ubiquinone oxidoreductase [Bacteroidota bacterium]
MLDNLKILLRQGRQYIPDVTRAGIPGMFRGRPVISTEKTDEAALVELCPTNAITSGPLCIDLGKCTFCGECAMAFPNKIKFTTDYKIATNDRRHLIIKEGTDKPIELDPEQVRKE